MKNVQSRKSLALFILSSDLLDILFYFFIIAFRLRSLPIDLINQYFGEKVGLYFTFKAHLSIWLVSPAIFGLLFEVMFGALSDGLVATPIPMDPLISLFIGIWSVMMLEFWQRTEKAFSMKAGMLGMEQQALDRPEYTRSARPRTSVINGQPEKFYSTFNLRCWRAFSTTIISVMIVMAIGITASIYIIRSFLYLRIGSEAQIVASVANALQIQMGSLVYNAVAFRLTDRENHRTDDQYQDSMVSR